MIEIDSTKNSYRLFLQLLYTEGWNTSKIDSRKNRGKKGKEIRGGVRSKISIYNSILTPLTPIPPYAHGKNFPHTHYVSRKNFYGKSCVFRGKRGKRGKEMPTAIFIFLTPMDVLGVRGVRFGVRSPEIRPKTNNERHINRHIESSHKNAKTASMKNSVRKVVL